MTGAGTLLLTRADVERLLDPDACIAAVEEAFRRHALGRMRAPGILGFAFEGGGFHIKCAAMDGRGRYFAVKINGNYPANPERLGIPAIQGVVLLCDAADGRPLALLDSISITAARTAAATAVAARRLARHDAATLTLCGCGTQGRSQVRALRRVRPIARVFAFDTDRTRSERFARELAPEVEARAVTAEELGEALRASDVIVTCTPSRRAFLAGENVSPGAFVAAVGADSPEKQELEPGLLASSKLVVDLRAQCAQIGELHHALAAGVLRAEDVHAELGEILAGRKPGRESDGERIVFDSTGTGLQDAAAAVAVYEQAVTLGFGRFLDFAAAR